MMAELRAVSPEWLGAPPLGPRLPEVRGRLAANAPIGGTTWFRVGGPAEILFRPADAADLAAFLAAKPGDVPVTVIGVGSNLLVRDGGIPGVTIRLGRGFSGIDSDAENSEIEAGAGALDTSVAQSAAGAGIGGLEFLSGVPGTIGGALRMNAGAYGGEIREILVGATAIDAQGMQHRLDAGSMGFGYRHCAVDPDWIFVAARLRGLRDSPETIGARMAEIRRAREASQPVRARTGGSTFANPPGDKAWRLIDQAGCRGLRRGGAAISEKHANFLINTGAATAADLEGLGEEVRRRVLENSGVALQWEIRRVGVPGPAIEAEEGRLA